MENKEEVNFDIQVYVTSIYSRKEKTKKTFSLILSGMLMSTVILGNIVISGVSQVFASENTPPSIQAVQAQQALLANLSKANQVLLVNGLTIPGLASLNIALKEIGTHLITKGFSLITELKKELNESEILVKATFSPGNGEGRTAAVKTIDQLRAQINQN